MEESGLQRALISLGRRIRQCVPTRREGRQEVTRGSNPGRWPGGASRGRRSSGDHRTEENRRAGRAADLPVRFRYVDGGPDPFGSRDRTSDTRVRERPDDLTEEMPVNCTRVACRRFDVLCHSDSLDVEQSVGGRQRDRDSDLEPGQARNAKPTQIPSTRLWKAHHLLPERWENNMRDRRRANRSRTGTYCQVLIPGSVRHPDVSGSPAARRRSGGCRRRVCRSR